MDQSIKCIICQNVAGAGKFEATAAPNITNVDNGGINYLTGTSAAVTQNVNQGGTIVGVISSARL